MGHPEISVIQLLFGLILDIKEVIGRLFPPRLKLVATASTGKGGQENLYGEVAERLKAAAC